ncbi:MAG: hypothetical protein LBM74_05245 [Oscillospiraceae bacterium]|jgi:hypothetical protein|nr:hypothetical protein [Oscillospiraceae bacterium]
MQSKRIIPLLAALLAALLPLSIPAASAAERHTVAEIGLSTAFPSGWTVVTPDTLTEKTRAAFDGSTLETAALLMRAEGRYLAAVSKEGDARLSVIALPGDETAAVYRDIERYTGPMRTAIANGFLDREAWAATGYRYSEAEWTNRAEQGRVLRLRYNVREGENIVARGLQAYTIRNGLAITLDLRVTGRSITSAESALFDQFVKDTVFPLSLNMPPLPVGIALDDPIPTETDKDTLVLRGNTLPGALVSAFLRHDDGQIVPMGTDEASSAGNFRIDITLPGEGDYRLFLRAALEGYADSETAGWISYAADRIPVTLTEYPEGIVYDTPLVVRGKTIGGVSIQCLEGEFIKKARSESNGNFSFTLDPAIQGERTVTLSLTKKGYDDRRVTITFDRQWLMADYCDYLDDKVQLLSYANFSGNPARYTGRMVRYSGYVVALSQSGARTYVQFALEQRSNGTYKNQMIAYTDGEMPALTAGQKATIYVEVDGGTYAFSVLDEDGEASMQNLPSAKLLAYQ